MRKTDKLKKFVIYFLGIVIGVSCSLCLIGCQDKTEDDKPRKDIYLEVRNNKGPTIYLGKENTSREKSMEFKYESDVLRFTTKAFYQSGEECLLHAEGKFDNQVVKLNKPGTYELKQTYPFSNGYEVVFKLYVTVKEKPDNRPVPEIEILPDDDCISYELNKKYVYKYDGEWHMPKYFNVYDCIGVDFGVPKYIIAKLITFLYCVNVEIVEGAETNRHFVDVGIYKFEIYVNDINSGIGYEGSRYAPASLEDIIIEIIN